METFVVRLVSAGSTVPSTDDEIRGVVRRVSDGEELTFTTAEQLLDFFRVAEREQM